MSNSWEGEKKAFCESQKEVRTFHQNRKKKKRYVSPGTWGGERGKTKVCAGRVMGDLREKKKLRKPGGGVKNEEKLRSRPVIRNLFCP